MRLILAEHSVVSMTDGGHTALQGGHLQIDLDELKAVLLEDRRLQTVELEIINPGEVCRAGYVFDIVEPRAKEPGSGVDFPGILGPPSIAGTGTTHVLRGAAVTVVDGGQPGGELDYVSRRGGMFKVLEMSGPASRVTPYSGLCHLVLVPHPFPEVQRHGVLNALRVASVRASVYLAQTAFGQEPGATQVLELDGGPARDGDGLPRIAYVGQIHGHHHGTEIDEHILYGGNTRGMMPVPLHPNEWLDGAVVISYFLGGRGLETFYYQNHPIVTELYRLHQAGELSFAGTVATTSSNLEEELNRNSMMAARLAKWTLAADGVILTKLGGAPQAEMFETARLCEGLGIKTVVLTSDAAPDSRAESALLMNSPDVDAIVILSEGYDITWQGPAAERVIAGNPDVADLLSGPLELTPATVCGASNNQGASRLRPISY